MAEHVGSADWQWKRRPKQNVYTNFIPYQNTNLTYHYHLIYLFAYEAVMDMIHKDGSWIVVPSADLPPTSYSAPRCLKAVSTLESVQ